MQAIPVVELPLTQIAAVIAVDKQVVYDLVAKCLITAHGVDWRRPETMRASLEEVAFVLAIIADGRAKGESDQTIHERIAHCGWNGEPVALAAAEIVVRTYLQTS